VEYEPRGDVREQGRSIINWLVEEIRSGRDSDRLLRLLQAIASTTDELEELRALGAGEAAIDACGSRRDRLLTEAIEIRRNLPK
jgi:hypothetical protein